MQIKKITETKIAEATILFGYKNRHERQANDFVFIFIDGGNKGFWGYLQDLFYESGVKHLPTLLERISTRKAVGLQDVGLVFSQEKQIWIANIMEFEEEGVSQSNLMIFLEEYLKNYIGFPRMNEDLVKSEAKLVENLESLLETHFVFQYKG